MIFMSIFFHDYLYKIFFVLLLPNIVFDSNLGLKFMKPSVLLVVIYSFSRENNSNYKLIINNSLFKVSLTILQITRFDINIFVLMFYAKYVQGNG